MEELPKILIVDDEINIRESLKLILSDKYEILVSESGNLAIDRLKELSLNYTTQSNLPELIILDIMMPGLDGLSTLKNIKSQYPNIPVIMLTASTTIKNAVNAMKFGAVDYISKPYDAEEFVNVIDSLIEQNRNRAIMTDTTTDRGIRSTDSIAGDFGCLVGRSKAMCCLYEKIEQIAKSDATVLLTGESGSGKELVAKELHKLSNRSHNHFIHVNCSAIPESLIESAFFGHENDYFIDSKKDRVGYFELADLGTLFLNEIALLHLSAQGKLLHFLEQNEFYRLGLAKQIKVDVRIIASTNQCLEQAIHLGNFRKDLYYRINVLTIELPPLRERKDDIPILVEFFAKRLAPIYGERLIQFTSDALDILLNYDWPGNVRELENITESILALSTSDEEIQVSDIPPRIRAVASNTKAKDKENKNKILDEKISFEEAERAFETEIITKALKRACYIQTKAAEILGISRRILKYKMDKLGISDKINN